MANDNRPCPCGSGEPSSWRYDARGIELGRMCVKCEKEKLAAFRPDVLTDSQYWADEDIDGDNPQVRYDEEWGTDNGYNSTIRDAQAFHDYEMGDDI
jgi:hypothetical protein